LALQKEESRPRRFARDASLAFHSVFWGISPRGEGASRASHPINQNKGREAVTTLTLRRLHPRRSRCSTSAVLGSISTLTKHNNHLGVSWCSRWPTHSPTDSDSPSPSYRIPLSSLRHQTLSRSPLRRRRTPLFSQRSGISFRRPVRLQACHEEVGMGGGREVERR
jgi:hypothetical protein